MKESDIDPLLLEAMREVDALVPESPRIAPPAAPAPSVLPSFDTVQWYYNASIKAFVHKQNHKQRVSLELVELHGWDKARYIQEEADDWKGKTWIGR